MDILFFMFILGVIKDFGGVILGSIIIIQLAFIHLHIRQNTIFIKQLQKENNE